jgi:hypothetical protein
MYIWERRGLTEKHVERGEGSNLGMCMIAT